MHFSQKISRGYFRLANAYLVKCWCESCIWEKLVCEKLVAPLQLSHTYQPLVINFQTWQNYQHIYGKQLLILHFDLSLKFIKL